MRIFFIFLKVGITGIQAPVGWDGKTLPQARRALGKAGDARAQQVYLLAPWNESLVYTASQLTNADSPTVVSLSKGEDGAVTLQLACGSVLTGIQAPVGWDSKTLPQARRALGQAGDACARADIGARIWSVLPPAIRPFGSNARQTGL